MTGWLVLVAAAVAVTALQRARQRRRASHVAGPSRSVPLAYVPVLLWCGVCSERRAQTRAGRCSDCSSDTVITVGNAYHYTPKPLPTIAGAIVLPFQPRGFGPLPLTTPIEPPSDEQSREVAEESERRRIAALEACRAAAGLGPLTITESQEVM